MFQNTKFTLYLEKRQRHVHTKMWLTLRENKFTSEGTNYKEIQIPLDISMMWYKINVYYTFVCLTINITYISNHAVRNIAPNLDMKKI